MGMTIKVSETSWKAKLGTIFNQKLDGNNFATANNWTTFNTTK